MRVSFLSVLVSVAIIAPTAHAQLVSDFEGFPTGSEVVFQEPSFSGSTSGNVAAGSASSIVTNLSDPPAPVFSGAQSLGVSFDWADETNAARWVRLTTNAAPNLPNPVIDFTQALAMKVYVASEESLGFTLGVRETNPTGAIGSNGGAAGGIEILGSTTGAPYTPTPSHVIAPGSWQDLVFVLPNEPIRGFAGASANGILESTTGKGVLEHLGIRPTGNAKNVRFYIDDIRVVSPNAIPEPGTLALLAGGLLPLLGIRRKR